MTGGMKVSLRMRLSARIIRDDHTSEAFHALNEVVVDRGEIILYTMYSCIHSSVYLWLALSASLSLSLSQLDASWRLCDVILKSLISSEPCWTLMRCTPVPGYITVRSCLRSQSCRIEESLVDKGDARSLLSQGRCRCHRGGKHFSSFFFLFISTTTALAADNEQRARNSKDLVEIYLSVDLHVFSTVWHVSVLGDNQSQVENVRTPR